MPCLYQLSVFLTKFGAKKRQVRLFDPAETHAMHRRGAVPGDRLFMFTSPIAFVLSKAVLWKLLVQFHHDPVVGHFRKNSRGSH